RSFLFFFFFFFSSRRRHTRFSRDWSSDVCSSDLHTNFASLVTQNTLNKNNGLLSTAMQRLGTGLRINSAADDAAGLQIANRLTAQTRGMAVAQRNAQDAISMLQTADGALDEISNIAFRMKDLALQAANGSNNADDRTAL